MTSIVRRPGWRTGDAVLEELLEVLDVARHPAHEDAGLLLGEEVEAQPLEVAEDGDPQVVHDPGGEPARHVDVAPLGGGRNDHGGTR